MVAEIHTHTDYRTGELTLTVETWSTEIKILIPLPARTIARASFIPGPDAEDAETARTLARIWNDLGTNGTTCHRGATLADFFGELLVAGLIDTFYLPNATPVDARAWLTRAGLDLPLTRPATVGG